MNNSIKALTQERKVLFEKMEDLKAYMTDMFGKSDEEMNLLNEQYLLMRSLSSVLKDRIKLIKNNK